MTHEEQLATIRRICHASGIRAAELSAAECVKLLAREHAARGAMVAVLTKECNRRITEAGRGMFTSEPLPERPSAFYAGDQYFADAEDARRARRDAADAQGREVERLADDARRRRIAADVATRRAVA